MKNSIMGLVLKYSFFFGLFGQGIGFLVTPWTGWGRCVGMCNTGYQYRFPMKRAGIIDKDVNKYESRECSIEKKCANEWGHWSSWSQCSNSCGGGSKIKVRQCRDSFTGHGAIAHCDGESFSKKFCNIFSCKKATCFDPSKINRQHYRGRQNQTELGHVCQSWNSTEFHDHKYHPSKYPGSGLDGNYCRNPDSDERPWCFTTSVDKSWDYCDVKCKHNEEEEDDNLTQWGQWSSWSACDVTCGGGTAIRVRSCMGIDNCAGNGSDSTRCNLMKCGAATPTREYYEHTLVMRELDTDLSTCHDNNAMVESRIFRGTVARHGFLQWQTMLVSNGAVKPFCGGTLLNTRFIVTAAHCVRNKEVGKFVAYTGRHSYVYHSNSEQKNTIIAKFVHPDYNHMNFENDIALLFTTTRYELDKFTQPACLPVSQNYNPLGDLVISGWGKTEAGENKGDLRYATVKMIPHNICKQLYKHRIYNNTMCAGGEDGSDTCQGDSGGGLVHFNTRTLLGVTSWGIGCGKQHYPGVYTKVGSFTEWIRQTVTNPKL